MEAMWSRFTPAVIQAKQWINEALQAVEQADAVAKTIADEQEKANHNAHVMLPAMERLRETVDNMEIITSRDLWPVPSYNNLLFYV